MVINCVLRLLIYSTRPYSIMATNNGGKFNDDASDKDMPIDIARNTKKSYGICYKLDTICHSLTDTVAKNYCYVITAKK